MNFQNDIKKMRNERLIAFYSQRLVKIENAYKDDADKKAIIQEAEKDLIAVKNGREW